jgi:hypothetical protein
MKIYIPSYNRPDTIATPWTLTNGWTDNSIDWKVILHDEQQRELYLKADRIGEKDIIVSGVPRDHGLGGQRAWIERNLVSDSEWYIQCDDNVTAFTKLEDPYYYENFFQLEDRQEQERLFNQVVSPPEFLYICEDMIEMMDTEGCYLGGFASTKNTFFRGEHWGRRHFIVGKTMILKKNNKAFFNPDLRTGDDYQITAANLLEYGKVLRNNFVYPAFPRYMPGGLGRRHERFEPYRVANEQLIGLYPGLFTYSDRADMPDGSSIRVRTFSDRTFEEWRRSLKHGK